jgi:hypothetical protein
LKAGKFLQYDLLAIGHVPNAGFALGVPGDSGMVFPLQVRRSILITEYLPGQFHAHGSVCFGEE